MKAVHEKIVPGEHASFRRLEWNETDFDCPYHCHEEVEITQILASRGERLVGDRFDTFARGDLAMFGPWLPHSYKNWRSGRARSRVVQFRTDAFGAGFLELPEFHAIRRLIRESARGLLFSEPTRRDATRLMGRLFVAPDGARRIALLIELLDLLGRDRDRTPMASHDYRVVEGGAGSERLERVLEHIDAHWRDDLRLADVARVAGLHPQSLSRYFRRRLGMTYQEYVIELRLSRAARQLLETNRAVSAIAFSCGFNNLANFNRLFAARYKASPTRYRSA